MNKRKLTEEQRKTLKKCRKAINSAETYLQDLREWQDPETFKLLKEKIVENFDELSVEALSDSMEAIQELKKLLTQSVNGMAANLAMIDRIQAGYKTKVKKTSGQ